MRNLRNGNRIAQQYWLTVVALILGGGAGGCVTDSSEPAAVEEATQEQTAGLEADELCIEYQASVSTGGVLRGNCYADNCSSTFRGNVTTGTVYDERADNIGVYGRFRLWDGTIIDVSDSNGSASGAGRINLSGGKFITKFECVSRDGGSSGWVSVHVNI